MLSTYTGDIDYVISQITNNMINQRNDESNESENCNILNRDLWLLRGFDFNMSGKLSSKHYFRYKIIKPND